jgi:hypothetical protein
MVFQNTELGVSIHHWRFNGVSKPLKLVFRNSSGFSKYSVLRKLGVSKNHFKTEFRTTKSGATHMADPTFGG